MSFKNDKIEDFIKYFLDMGTSTRSLASSTPVCTRTRKVDAAQSPDVSYIDGCTSAPEMSEHSILVNKSSCKSNRRRPKKQVAIQIPETEAKAADVQELFFHGRCRGFATSTPKKKCTTFAEWPRVLSSMSLPKCTDESRSLYEDANESVSRSEADSPSAGSCESASARAQYYQNKLTSTLRILQNKDETVRVQAESLSVAEARIVALTARNNELKKDIDRKNREIKTLRETVKGVEKSDACVWVDTQETDSQTNVMKTLQNNLSVIEDLYRECFYETAKQEGIVEMLRKSYLDVRLMEKDKSEQITKLNNVINTQKWSLDRYQDIASEVDNLKIEITNFLNNSNNDSGVWEESADGVMEDLQDINAQLLSLRELLTGDCTCGLEPENKRLKQANKMLETKVTDLNEKISDLENILNMKETADRKLEEDLAKKERELQSLRCRLVSLENESRECCRSCETSFKQLQQSQVLLKDKSEELCIVQSKCKQYEDALKVVKKEVEKYQECDKEKCTLREEVKQQRREVRALRAQLLHSQRHSASLQECCRQEAHNVELLESELTVAATRGAALCTAARRAVHTVRGWAAQLRDAHREQATLIETKDSQLRALRQQIEQLKRCKPCPALRQVAAPDTCTKCCATDDSPPAPRRVSIRRSSEDVPTCSRCLPERDSRSRVRRDSTSTSEMASSSAPAPSPPPRSSRKRQSCHELSQCVRNVSIQLPVRRDFTCACDLFNSDTDVRCQVTTDDPIMQWSPCEELFSRVEGAGAALAAALSRWRKPPPSAGNRQHPAHTSSE